MKKEEDQTTTSKVKKKTSYVWIGRRWLVGILVLMIGLVAANLWFVLDTDLVTVTDSATVIEKITINSLGNQSSSDSASASSNSSSSTTMEERGIELAKEIKEYAAQGKVYGVPFSVDGSLSEVNRVWGPHDDVFRGSPYWLFDDKDVGFYTESMDINNGHTCAITLQYTKNPGGSLPPHYEAMTFDHVREVFGNNYRLEQVFDNTGTESADVYFYHLPPYGVEFWVSEGKIRLLQVGTERCGIFGSKVDFFYR